MDGKTLVVQALQPLLQGEYDIFSMIERPKHEHLGDFAFPCFVLAKEWKRAPQHIASELAERLQSDDFDQVVATGPYINFFLNKGAFTNKIVAAVLVQGAAYGASEKGTGKTIVVDFSSPNIAKPFSMGHLRSTVLGMSLSNIAEKVGFTAVKVNHLGDWGTQFGKLIVAYKKWGSEAAVQAQPIQELLKLYVKFHEEAKHDPVLEDEARARFKALEDGDEETRELWQWFRAESLREFDRTYELMNITFDSYDGEAFYNDKMTEVVELLVAKQLLVESDGARVVPMDGDLPPCIIQKTDGATMYATRDLAAALYRQRTYQFDQVYYVVGQEQGLHFFQVKQVLQKLGFDWSNNLKHIPFGLVLQDGKKMSTRKGGIVKLETVLQEAIALATAMIEEKNPTLANKEEVARQVGVGAIIFYDLRNERMNGYDFSLADMVRVEGETGPYVQYTHARASSLLRKAAGQPIVAGPLHDEEAWEVVKKLATFADVVYRAYKKQEPSVIAKYAVQLAQTFNRFYAHTPILTGDDRQAAKLALVAATKTVLAEALRLLHIEAPNEM